MRKVILMGCALLLSAAMTRAQQTSPSGTGGANGPSPQAYAPKTKHETKKTSKANVPTVKPAQPATTVAPSPPAIVRRPVGHVGTFHRGQGMFGGGQGWPAGRVTAAAFLPSPESEVPGYGLYSYILFGSRPLSGSDRWWRLYYETITEFLRMPALYEELRFVPPARMNITLLPVTSPRNQLPSALTPFFQFNQDRLNMCRTEHPEAGELPSHDINGPSAISNAGAVACILVEDYDYARAAAMLSLFAAPHMGGPYIISATQPLSGADKLPPHYLYQDLSSVPLEVVPLWITQFMVQARDEEFWKTRTKDEFVLRVRTLIAAVNQQLPDFSVLIRWQLPTAQAANPPSNTVRMGQTTEEVIAILGQPEDIVDLGNTKIYVYKNNLKIFFAGGKVSDAK